VADVYEALVRTSIEKTGSRIILCFIRKPGTLTQLPSWVPDFSVEHSLDAYNVGCPMGFLGANGNNWHNRGAPSPGCSLDLQDRPGELSVNSFVGDTPLIIAGTWQCTETKNRQWTFFKIMDEYSDVLDKTDSDKFPDLHNTRHRRECFWRTLIWNANAND
jgi:hypothetical protein